jgi:hypothetical protein
MFELDKTGMQIREKKGIMFMGKVNDGTAVVVENLWKNLVKRLPGVLHVPRFGQ